MFIYGFWRWKNNYECSIEKTHKKINLSIDLQEKTGFKKKLVINTKDEEKKIGISHLKKEDSPEIALNINNSIINNNFFNNNQRNSTIDTIKLREQQMSIEKKDIFWMDFERMKVFNKYFGDHNLIY